MYAMMSRFCCGVIVVSLKTGIASGPVSMASKIWVGVDLVSGGRVLAVGQRAAGADEVVALRRSSATNSCWPSPAFAPSGLTSAAVGIAGPPPSDAM